MWFGWFGFNGGSALAASADVPQIIVNTVVATAFSGVVAIIICIFMSGKVIPEKLFNGIIGGLVGITAGCAVVDIQGAIGLGVIGALLVYWGDYALKEVWMTLLVLFVPTRLAVFGVP